MSILWHAPIRTICIASGRTWGAGANLLVACDERLAVDGASFRFPGPAFGVVLGSRWRSELIDVDRAREVLTRGLEREAFDALAAGLVRETCRGDDVVRVEPPKSDAMRQWSPISDGYSENFASVDRGKGSRWT